MGYWGLLFFSEKVTQLKAFRDTLKDEAEKSKLDEIIKDMESKLENKSK